MNVGERVKALRAALGLTQEQVAERSLGKVNQGTLAKVESGKNKLTGLSTREGLASAFGISLEDFGAYLHGNLDLSAMTGRRRPGPPLPDPRPELKLEREDTRVPEDDELPLETAALRVMDRERHTLKDLDAVRAAIRAAPRKEIPGADLEEMALRFLDAARKLRMEGEAATPSALLWRVAVGRHQREAEVAAEVDAAYNAEADEELRAIGGTPDVGRAEIARRLAAQKARTRA